MYAAITIGGQTGTTGDVVDDYNPVQHGVTMPTEAPVNAVIKIRGAHDPYPHLVETLKLLREQGSAEELKEAAMFMTLCGAGLWLCGIILCFASGCSSSSSRSGSANASKDDSTKQA